MANRLRIAVVIMSYGGQICVRQAAMWLELGATALLNFERLALTSFVYLDMNPVDKARNYALGLAMRAQADWLLMVDADTFVAPLLGITTPGDQIIRMIVDAAAIDVSIVIAPVRSRDKDRRIIMAYTIEDRMTKHINMPGTVNGAEIGVRTYKSIEIDPKPDRRGPVPIDAGSAAVMAINLHKVGDASFRFVPGLSEDLEFCRQIRADGGKIFCDTRVVTGHMARPEAILSVDDTAVQYTSISEIKDRLVESPK